MIPLTLGDDSCLNKVFICNYNFILLEKPEFPCVKTAENVNESQNTICKYSRQVNNILKLQYIADTYCTNVCCSYVFTILFSYVYFASTLHGIKQMYLATVEFE